MVSNILNLFKNGVLNDTQKRDQIKNEYCLLNNIIIHRIKHDENINERMNKILNNI